MRTLLLTALVLPALALAKPPKGEPAPPVEVVEVPADQPRMVSDGSTLAGASGVRATVLGVLERATHDDVEGTAIRLSDGALVFVSQGEPPEGWAWMLGTKVRVQGELWSEGAKVEGAWPVPTLMALEPPMPGDMDMPGMGL